MSLLKLNKITYSETGNTLVETMASIAIFVFILSAVMNVAVTSASMGKRSEFAYTAYNLAKNHLETLRSMPYSNLANAAETESYIDANGVSDPDGPYIRSTAISQNYNSDANLIQVTVSVKYIFRGEMTNNPISLSTVIFQYA